MASEGIEFFAGSLGRLKMTGTIFKSSKSTAEKLITHISPPKKKSRVGIELGAGTGVVTRKILEKIGDEKLFAFENNSRYIRTLEKIASQDFRLNVVGDCAGNLLRYVNRASYVISVLPLRSFEAEFNERIIRDVYKVLESGGVFVQFQYIFSGKRDYEKTKETFGNVEWEHSFWNLFPGWIYHAVKN